MLRPATLRVDPGGDTSFEISVRNTGTIVDEFSFEIRGDPAPWASVEPAVLRLFPGAEGLVTVRFRPPKTPTTRAGLTPFGVKVISKEDPEGTIVEEGTLEIGSFSENTVELIPRTSHGRLGASHDVYIDNRGNQRVSTTIDAVDPDEQLEFRINPPTTAVDPGAATRVRVRAKPKKRFLRGQPKSHPFKVLVQPEGDQALQADGNMLQQPLLPRWLIPALLVLAALVLVWFFLLKPLAKTAAEEAIPENVAETNELAAAEKRAADALAAQAAAAAKADKALQEQIEELVAGGAGGVKDATDQRLDPVASDATNRESAAFTVPDKKRLTVTDLILQNPGGDFGILTIMRDPDPAVTGDEQVLLLEQLENFRDIDYHFVTPLIFQAGQQLILVVECKEKNGDVKNVGCANVAVLYTGSLAKA